MIVNVAICVALIPRIGIIGGAVATTVSYVTSVIVMLLLFARHRGSAPQLLSKPDLRD